MVVAASDRLERRAILSMQNDAFDLQDPVQGLGRLVE
jgi:hypothetical protein